MSCHLHCKLSPRRSVEKQVITVKKCEMLEDITKQIGMRPIWLKSLLDKVPQHIHISFLPRIPKKKKHTDMAEWGRC
ncbi:hypothetical protein Y032_0061g3255 [Ancylostoma ceylanicum]|uniref:Uncharacterized protein n=1 Tax=Ancylostoma ceylanicum TaxID=53326 RepID=A0A016U1T4_9BILA|nr:hypothetical protein Y032_0061g3255 [Ancylostoma ceylanicum]